MIFSTLATTGSFMRVAIALKQLHDLDEKGAEKAEKLSKKLASLMRLSLRTNIFGLATNKELTIEAKGKNQPGVDTGQMMNAIQAVKIAEDEKRSGTQVIYFVGIRNDAEANYPGPVSSNFEDGAWSAYYNPIPLVSVAYLFVKGQVVKMPPHSSRLGDSPPRDFVTPAFEQMEPEIAEEFEQFTKKFILSI